MNEAELREIGKRATKSKDWRRYYEKSRLTTKEDMRRQLVSLCELYESDVLRLTARVRELEGENHQARAAFSGLRQIVRTCVAVVKKADVDSSLLEEQIERFEEKMALMEEKMARMEEGQ